MAFPQGIAFRATSGYVTEGTNDDYEISTVANYPRTSAQGNTVGYESTPGNTRNRNSGVDARLAGTHIVFAGATKATFRMDLPSTGDYKIRMAAGDYGSYGSPTRCKLIDSSTSLGEPNTVATTAAQRWRDAVGTEYNASTWPGSNALSSAYTFASTILRLEMNSDASSGCSMSYFYVESAGGAAAGNPRHSLVARQAVMRASVY